MNFFSIFGGPEEAYVWYWEGHYDTEKVIMILRRSLWYWEGHYDTGVIMIHNDLLSIIMTLSVS